MAATGGMGTGGRGTGGAPATGGRGTGGAATGGAATGGAATGGAATGGAATGGAGTGGAGTGGANTGGAAPTRLILSIDFVGGRTTPAMAMADSEIAGARPAAHWNSAQGAMGSLMNLTLSDGTTSSASITWNAPAPAPNTTGVWTVNYTDAPGDVRMMNGYLDPSWTSIPATTPPALFTISGLPATIASGRYDVYIYTLADVPADTRTYQYSIGSLYESVTQSSPPPTPPSPYVYTSANTSMTGNHVVFTSLTGASVPVVAKPVSGTNARYRAPVNGVQIVWPSGS